MVVRLGGQGPVTSCRLLFQRMIGRCVVGRKEILSRAGSQIANEIRRSVFDGTAKHFLATGLLAVYVKIKARSVHALGKSKLRIRS